MKKLFRMPAITAGNRRILRITAAAVLIAAALFVFGMKGESQSIELTDHGNDSASSAEQIEKKEYIYVDIDGEVNSPGVYKVKQGSRIFEVIEKAGGLRDKADTSGINQAGTVKDGDKIIIPAKGAKTSESGGGTASAGGASGSLSGQSVTGGTDDGSSLTFININSADSTDLQKIPGVGPVTAEKIIAYREQNGYFRRKEDIKNVSGIGDKTYEKMKDIITV